jgi:hypothetical protein
MPAICGASGRWRHGLPKRHLSVTPFAWLTFCAAVVSPLAAGRLWALRASYPAWCCRRRLGHPKPQLTEACFAWLAIRAAA